MERCHGTGICNSPPTSAPRRQIPLARVNASPHLTVPHPARHPAPFAGMRYDVRRLCHTLALIFLTTALPAHAADLRLALAVEPDSIDPHVHNFGGNKAFMPHLFEALTVIDGN